MYFDNRDALIMIPCYPVFTRCNFTKVSQVDENSGNMKDSIFFNNLDGMINQGSRLRLQYSRRLIW